MALNIQIVVSSGRLLEARTAQAKASANSNTNTTPETI
jgi:hypothetical protein